MLTMEAESFDFQSKPALSKRTMHSARVWFVVSRILPFGIVLWCLLVLCLFLPIWPKTRYHCMLGWGQRVNEDGTITFDPEEFKKNPPPEYTVRTTFFECD